MSRTEYSDLWKAIDVAWGEGDRGTTLNVPDLRGVFLRGVNHDRTDAYADPDAGNRLGLPGGNKGNQVGSFQSDTIQKHGHQWAENDSGDLRSWNRESEPVKALDRLAHNQIPGGSGKDDDYMDVANVPGGFWTKSEHSIGNREDETRPRNAYVSYIIKY